MMEDAILVVGVLALVMSPMVVVCGPEVIDAIKRWMSRGNEHPPGTR